MNTDGAGSRRISGILSITVREGAVFAPARSG